ncbi:UNVERIFIED_CONTAM: endonuclease/exonuclease/phosphatase family metal-dependent hydrolase [Williamsia faeni]
MTLTVDRNVHVVAEYPPVIGAALPALAEPAQVRSVIDRVGKQVRNNALYVFGGCGVGAVVGATTGLGVARGALGGATTGAVFGIRAGRVRLRPQVVAVGAGSVPAVTPVATETLRVMEFNVHGGMGGPGKYFATPAKLDLLAETIRQERPDIVLLQELDDCAVRSNFVDTLRRLVKRLQPTGAVMTPAIEKVNGRREGTGVMTFNGATITAARGLRIGDALGDNTARRFRATADAWAGVVSGKLGHTWLPFGGMKEYQPRVATDVMVHTAGGNHVRVLSGHFSPPQHGIDEPKRQIEPVVATIGTWQGPTIFGADFNIRDGSPEFVREHEVFADAGLSEATAGAPSGSDRVYTSTHFTAANPQKLVLPQGAVRASDHYPVVVDLTLRQ